MNFKRSTYIYGATVRGALSILKKFVKKVEYFNNCHFYIRDTDLHRF